MVGGAAAAAAAAIAAAAAEADDPLDPTNARDALELLLLLTVLDEDFVVVVVYDEVTWEDDAVLEWCWRSAMLDDM